MFVEEPVPQENVDALKLVSDKFHFQLRESACCHAGNFAMLEKGAVSYIQPDGFTLVECELSRIANMAETYYVHIMPHCAIGPVALAACCTLIWLSQTFSQSRSARPLI